MWYLQVEYATKRQEFCTKKNVVMCTHLKKTKKKKKKSDEAKASASSPNKVRGERKLER